MEKWITKSRLLYGGRRNNHSRVTVDKVGSFVSGDGLLREHLNKLYKKEVNASGRCCGHERLSNVISTE
jgi:hypothetical protein